MYLFKCLCCPPGYRHVHLLKADGSSLSPATLFIHVKVVRRGVPIKTVSERMGKAWGFCRDSWKCLFLEVPYWRKSPWAGLSRCWASSEWDHMKKHVTLGIQAQQSAESQCRCVIQSAFCFFIVHLWCCLQSRTSSRVIEVLPWKLNMLWSQYCSKLQVSVVYRVRFHWDRFLLSLWTLKSENVTFYENVIF